MDENLITPDVFDRQRDWGIEYRRLPHWSQAGTLCFITFRTSDSLPANVLKAWYAERSEWLANHNIIGPLWREGLQQLEISLQRAFHERFSLRWQNHLDACHGECVLRQSELAQIVAGSLEHCNEKEYLLTDYVIMPNHVHVLAAFRDEEGMLRQCESWKHFTAREINRRLGRSGRFWQQDGFDHLIRSAEQFFRVRRYIAANPAQAKLSIGEFLHVSKALPGQVDP